MGFNVADKTALLSPLDKAIINQFQHDFPLTSHPFADIAKQLGSSEAEVLERLSHLAELGILSRIGPVFKANRIGVSTLSAMAVPELRLNEVADFVSGLREVNHNYLRTHRYNLWFVLTAKDEDSLQAAIAKIEARTQLEVLDLRMKRPYYIDLGFAID